MSNKGFPLKNIPVDSGKKTLMQPAKNDALAIEVFAVSLFAKIIDSLAKPNIKTPKKINSV